MKKQSRILEGHYELESAYENQFDYDDLEMLISGDRNLFNLTAVPKAEEFYHTRDFEIYG